MRTSTGYATRIAMDNTSGDRTPITQFGAADGKQAATTAGTQIGGYLLSGPDRGQSRTVIWFELGLRPDRLIFALNG